MGNQIVIPSYGDWYVEPLKRNGITVLKQIESGTFFICLDCIETSTENPVIVKAYQYSSPLSHNLPEVDSSMIYLKELENYSHSSLCGLTPFFRYFIEGNNAFLVRKKAEYTLGDRMGEYPPLHDVEKLWISFQLFNSLANLHDAQLVHGSLNPDNVLITDDLRTTICDMSPFKPSLIREDKVNFYYHYFTTAKRSACYLAPGQIKSKNEQPNSVTFNRGTFSSDIFSLASIIYFLYSNGNHLFTFSSLCEYSKTKNHLNLDCIPEQLRETIRKMLSLDFNERFDAFKGYKEIFPNSFQQLFEQICTFHEGGTTMEHIIALIPVFESIVEKDNEDRIILSNAFNKMLYSTKHLDELINFLSFCSHFASKIEDEYVITRIIPYFMDFLKFKSTVVICAALRSLYYMISNFKSVLDGFFSDYFIPRVLHLTNEYIDFKIRACLAELLPGFVSIIYKHIEHSTSNDIDKLLHFIVSEQNEYVLNTFIRSLRNVGNLPFSIFNLFFPILTTGLNSNIISYRLNVIDTFIYLYENCNIYEKHEYMSLYSKLLPALCGFLDEEQVPEVTRKLLEALLWFIDNKIFQIYRFPEIYKTISNINCKGDQKSIYFVRKLRNILPKEFEVHDLPEFLWSFMQSSNHPISSNNNTDNKNTEFSNYSCSSIIQAGVHMRPYFINSLKISQFPIVNCTQSYSNDIITVCCDSNKTIHVVSNTFSHSVYIQLPSKITAIGSMKEHNSTLFGDSEGVISVTNWTNSYMSQIQTNDHSVPVSCIAQNDQNSFFSATQESVLNLFDIRTMRQESKISFDSELSAKCICKWPLAPYIGIGFEEGLVTLIDTRMFLPVKSIVTQSPNQIIPIYHNELSFAISSNGLECYSFSGNNFLSFNKGTDVIICEYDGGLVCLDQTDAYFINASKPENSYFLFDPMHTSHLTYHDNTLYKDKRPRGRSLHQHSIMPTCFCRTKDYFISFDQLGFCNIWDI